MAFDAGAVESRLTIDTSTFDRSLTDAEARVKRFEDEGHKVKIAAEFDQSSFSKARKAFTDLDNAISKDAMSRLRSSPQGSVLGALNALFSPHPVTGAPSPQQAAQQGLLGKIIQAPGGGGTTGPVGGNNQGNVVQDVLGSAGGGEQSNANRVSTVGIPPQDTTTTDKVNVVGGPTDNNITTTDRVNTVGLPTGNDITTQDRVNVTGLPTTGGTVTTEDKIKPDLDTTDLKVKAEEAGKDAADDASDSAGQEAKRKGSGWFAGMLSGIGGMVTKALDDAVSGAGGGGKGSKGGSASGLASNILGGIGPSILGIGLKATAITGAVGTALAALPALGGVVGAGVGTALIGGLVAGVVAGSPGLKAEFSSIGKQAADVLKAAGAPIIPALQAVLGQVPGLLKSIEPQLAGVFKAVAPQLQGVFAGLVPIVKGLVSLIQAAAPAFGPFIQAIEKLVSGLFPGLVAVTKAVVPVMTQFGTIMGQLGSNLGALFGDLAPAVSASMTVLGALFGLIGGLLPVISKLADVFALALAPVITQFAGTIKALSPSLTAIGTIIADLAGAIIGDLASALGSLATLLTGIAPGLNAFATAIGSVFTVLENTGTFAILGNAIEDLAGPLAKLINTLLTGLVPILPPIVNFIGQLSTLIATTLANAIQTLLPPLTTLVTGTLQVLDALLPVLLPLLLSFAGVFTGGVVAAIAAVAGALADVISAIPPPVLGAIVTGIAAVVGGMKLWAGATTLLSTGIESTLAGAVGGMIGTLREFALATEGVTLAQKAQLAGMLALDAVSPLAWAAIGVGLLGALTVALVKTNVQSTEALAGFQQQNSQIGYNIAGYKALAAQLDVTSAGFAKSAQASSDAVRGGQAGMANLSSQATQLSQVASQEAVNMQQRLGALTKGLGVSQTQVEQWASAAGISASKFAGAGENVGLLTAQIVGYVNKNASAITATASLSTNMDIFSNDVFSTTTQLDAFNGIWTTLVGNLLTKQEALTTSKSQFDALAQTIKTSGANSDAANQSFQQYITQIGSSASTLVKQGASIDTVNGYLQTQIDHIGTLGPLNAGEKADLQALKTFQDALANSTKGLTDNQLTWIHQAEQNIIPDLVKMHADTPLVNTDIGKLANSIAQTGTNSASTEGDRAQLIKDLENAGVSAKNATSFVNGLTTSLSKVPKSVGTTVTVSASALGTLTAAAKISGTSVSNIEAQLQFGAAGMYVSGGSPGKDSVLAMLMPGEVVVPTAMVQGGAVDHLRGSIPGFAAGGMVNLGAPYTWALNDEKAWAQDAAAAFMSKDIATFNAAVKAASAAQAAASAFIGTQGATGGIIQAMMQTMAAAKGWTGAELTALFEVESREAGFNMTATNPSSGAYGLAQFINGPSEYAQYGGNSTTAQGQITGMLNYISCMPLDAAILTRTGWKSHAEVQVGDETVGFDPETGEARWTVITAVHHYDAAPVRRMRNTTVDLRATPNHRWIAEKFIQTGTSKPDYYRQEMVRTDQIGTRHRIRLAARLTQEETLPLTSVEAELLGWIAGDGSVYRRDMYGKGFGNCAEVSVFQSEVHPLKLRRLRALMTGMPHSEYTRPPKDGRAPIHQLRLRAPFAHDLLMRSGYEGSPELMVLRMSAPQREAFLLGLLMADGHRHYGDDGWMLAQNEGPVLDAAVLAATLLGNFCNLTNSGGQKHVVVTRGPFVKGGLDARHQEECGEEPVWCVTTELGTWTARQDSQVFLTGNSRYGDPIAAEAHEAAFGWYDRGGPLKPGYTLAYNGTGRTEQVVSGKSMDDLANRLDQLHADMQQMVTATRQVPAGVGQHVGGAINGAAHDASFRSRYPRGTP